MAEKPTSISQRIKGDSGATPIAEADAEVLGFVQRHIWPNLLPMLVPNGRLALPFFLLHILQSLGVAFSFYHPVSWHNGFASWLIQVADNTLLQSTFFADTSAMFAAWAIVVGFYVLFAAGAALKQSSNRDWSGLLFRLANYVLSFLMLVFYLPAASVFGSFLSCTTKSATDKAVLSPIAHCWTGSNAVYPAFAIIGIVLLTFTVLLYYLYMQERVPYDTATLGMAHGRILAVEAFFYMGLIFANSALANVIGSQENVRWALNIISLLATALICYLNIVYQPYYNTTVQSIKVAASAYLCWCCAAIVILEAIPAAGYEAISLLYVTGTFIVLSAIWLSNARRSNVARKPYESIESSYELELKIRLQLNSANAFWSQKSIVMSGEKGDTSEEHYRVANQAFMQGLKKLPTPFLFTAYSTFLFGKCNFNYALTVVSKAKRTTEIDFDFAFHVFKTGRLIEHIFAQQKGTLEVKRYFQFLNLSRKTEVLQTQFTAKKVAFLAELRKNPVNPKRLQMLGRQFLQLLGEIEHAYQTMFNLNSASKVLRRYASFVSNLLGSAEMTKLVVEYADQLDLEGDNSSDAMHKVVALESQAALFDERNAVFVISGVESNLGEILEVNLGGVDMFGFTVSTELVGTNISSLMPSPFSEMHNGFLRKYLETGVAIVLDQTREVIARHRLGHIFQVRLYVRQIVDRKGEISFIGIMARTEAQPELIILDGAGYLLAISQNCIGTFQSDDPSEELTEDNFMQKVRTLHISRWFENWGEERELFLKEYGHTIKYRGMQTMHMKLKDLSELSAHNYWALEIWTNSSLGSRSSLHSKSEEVIGFVPPAPREEARLVPRANATETKSARSVASDGNTASATDSRSDSFTKRSQFSEVFGHKDEDNEASDMLLRNTAVNLMHRYEELMRDYMKRYNVRSTSNGGGLLFWLKFLGACYLLWLIVSNSLLNGILSELLLDIHDLSNDGVRNMEIIRIVSTTRSLQTSAACNAGYSSTLCTLVATTRWTNYSDTELQSVLSHAAEDLVATKETLIKNMIHKKNDAVFVEKVANQFVTSNVPMTILREQSGTIIKMMSALDAVEFFSSSVDYLWRYPWTTLPAKFVGSNNVAINEALLASSSKLFNNSYPLLASSITGILVNTFNLHDVLDASNSAYQEYYELTLTSAIGSYLILTIVPVGFLLLGIAAYILPNLKRLVDWQADILTTFIFRQARVGVPSGTACGDASPVHPPYSHPHLPS